MRAPLLQDGPKAGLSLGLAGTLAGQAVAGGGAVDSAKLFEQSQEEFMVSPAWGHKYIIWGCETAYGER